MRTSARLLLAAPPLALALAGCSHASDDPKPKGAAALSGVGFDLVEGSRLVVRGGDGRPLLEGLPPGDVAEGAPPLVGFAVREVARSYQMQYGAFKPTDAPAGPWDVARTISETDEEGGATFELADATGSSVARVSLRSPDAGHLVADVVPTTSKQRVSWGFSCAASDHFAGFGEQTWDVDHRGQTVPTFVQEEGIGKIATDTYDDQFWYLQGRRHSSQAPFPEYLARRGYVLAVETDVEARFALCSEREDAARIEIDGPARIHVFDGADPAKALERATATFGRPRVPPRVAFAPWNDAIFGSANVRAVAKALRDAKIPSSVLWSEDWRGGEWSSPDDYRLAEEWEVDPTLYPDMKALTDELHSEGFDFQVYFNPFVYKSSKAWGETAAQGLLVRKADGTPYTFTGAKFTECGLVDVFKTGGAAWVASKLDAAMSLGADGWMCDFAEWLPTDAVVGDADESSFSKHNLYPVAWQKAHRDAIDARTDGASRLFFARSGWLGSPELVDVFWAGDQRTDFQADDGFPTILPIGIGLGLAGVSTYAHDIAGYQSTTNPTSTKELFFRWTELGAWSPVMRTHHGTKPKKEWAWDTDAETTAHFRRFAAWHMALVPYFETLAAEAHATGMPIWRGLMLGYPDDEAAWGVKDEVLVGPGVLVAPVMSAGATSRSVYLPRGDWFAFSTGAKVSGPTTAAAAAPVGEIPVFARAGTIVPTFPDGVMTLSHGSAAVPDASSVGSDRVIYAFLGADGAFAEATGAAYRVAHDATASKGTLAVSLDGKALAACDAANVAPCADVTGESATVRLAIASGTAVDVAFGGADAVHVDAVADARKLTIVARR